MLLFGAVGLVLVAFAANSLLCRLALEQEAIDPMSFTAIRLVAGALMLAACSAAGRKTSPTGDAVAWWPAISLFGYAILFSVAYQWLSAATGALALFGAVQITMMIFAKARGESVRGLQWLGFVLANAGLLYLLLPGIESPSPLGLVMMFGSGVSWGVYSALGKTAKDPILATTINFRRAALFAIPICFFSASQLRAEAIGVVLACVSGAITSGLGYVGWYSVLPRLSTSQASLAQLLVPVIAAVGAVLFLGEELRLQLLVAGALILGGIAIPFVSDPSATSNRKKN